MEPLQAEILFVLPDIGGYTQFMIHTKETPERAQTIITELMKAMLKQIHIPLRIAEIEGDALFLWARKENEAQWKLERDTIAQTLENFLTSFYAEARILVQSKVCECNVCTEVSNLRIKVIVHKGTAVIDKLDRFETVTGVDAIIAHRLLKNTVPFTDYILASKQAFDACRFPHPERFVPRRERYDDIGVVDTMVAEFK